MSEPLKVLEHRMTEPPKNTDEWQDWHDLVDDAHEVMADHVEQQIGDEPGAGPAGVSATEVKPCDVPQE